MTLTFNLLRAMVMIYLMKKSKINSLSIPKIEWKQTDGQTDGGDCITSHGNYLQVQHVAVIFNTVKCFTVASAF